MQIDLEANVLPISKAASSLAALIKRAGATGEPIIVTQKGYPTGVILGVKLFERLRKLEADTAANQVDEAELDRLLAGFVPDAPESGADEVAAFLEAEA
jgi:prevent-host-death family protein